MIGLRIRLTLEGSVMDEIELRDLSPGTKVLKKIREFEKIDNEPEIRASLFYDTYSNIFRSYDAKLMSNENLVLSVSSFVYSGDERDIN